MDDRIILAEIEKKIDRISDLILKLCQVILVEETKKTPKVDAPNKEAK